MTNSALPLFAVVVGYFIPADGPWDPARHTRRVIAYTQTGRWARVLAARAYKQFEYTTEEGDVLIDDQGYTDVIVLATGSPYRLPRAWDVTPDPVDADIPF